MGKRSIEKERHWRQIVARFERSGMKVRAFCDRARIKEQQFFTWRRELRRRDVARTYPSGEALWASGASRRRVGCERGTRRENAMA